MARNEIIGMRFQLVWRLVLHAGVCAFDPPFGRLGSPARHLDALVASYRSISNYSVTFNFGKLFLVLESKKGGVYTSVGFALCTTHNRFGFRLCGAKGCVLLPPRVAPLNKYAGSLGKLLCFCDFERLIC